MTGRSRSPGVRPARGFAGRTIELVHLVVEWYLRRYHGTPADLGGPAMFCDPRRMGAFASSANEFSAGRDKAIFKVIVASTLFQRRQDQQVFRILRGLRPKEVNGIVTARHLQRAAGAAGCEHLRSQAALHASCDIEKTAEGHVTCRAHPTVACSPKTHAIALRRYADFGKLPTSAALLLRERGLAGFGEIYRRLATGPLEPEDRAAALETELTAVWRVSEKIGAMILSALSNPDLGAPPAPWTKGLDWQRWIVVDSNVDKFLAYIGRGGGGPYAERTDLIRTLARFVPLARLKPGLADYNPRIVQQAIYMFMSASNRRASSVDCLSGAPNACRKCNRVLRAACPVRSP
jgi:hypothetical protein